MKAAYIDWTPAPKSLALLQKANEILETFKVKMTVRQLYYQLVAADVIPNNISSYRKVVRVVRDGRMAGLLDWDWIEDRLREPKTQPTWNSIESIIDAARSQFQLDRWEDQDHYIEVWVEKDALAGICGEVAKKWQATLQVNRGYSSASAMRAAAQRFRKHRDHTCIIGYLGDHDPSGEDMVRDVADRLRLFGAEVMVMKLAIDSEDIERYDLPPQPVKASDARAAAFRLAHGDDCVELDALRPDVLKERIENFITDHLDRDAWDEVIENEERQREAVRVDLGEVE